MPVRSIVQAARVESAPAPYDTLALRLFYPAAEVIGPTERETGLLPPQADAAPFPVVIFFPGVNCPDHVYHWLAIDLAARGLAVVTFNWVAENLPGRISLTPGIRRDRLTPDTYGSGPSSSSLPAVLEALGRIQGQSILAEKLDLTGIILGGHSAGGMMALLNADPRWFPAIVAAFAYCSSPLPTLALGGFPPGRLAPLPSAVPCLLIGATEDGIGALHNQTMGLPGKSGADTLIDTFNLAITSARGDSHLVILRGANHHTICYPRDDTIGRTFADSPSTADEPRLRALLAGLIGEFIAHSLTARPWQPLPANELIALARTK
jgi:pimeloyl-ACP methyl ester carboxylesterase